MINLLNCKCILNDSAHLSGHGGGGLGDLCLVDLNELTDEVDLHLDGVQVPHARFREVVALQDLNQLGAVRRHRYGQNMSYVHINNSFS